MTDYPFGIQLAVSPLNENDVIRNGMVWIYATTDTDATTPLSLTDLSGLPLTNPLLSNAYGYTRTFITNVPQVKWKSGEMEGLFESYIGMRNEATAAALAAQDAATAAQAAGTTAAAAASSQLATAVTAAGNSATAAGNSASAATAAQAAAAAAQASAAAAAAATAGGGFAIDPGNPNTLLISTLNSGAVAIDPTNTNVLIVTF